MKKIVYTVFLCLFTILICKSQTPLETVNSIENFSVNGNANLTMDFQTAIVSYQGSIFYAYVDASLNAIIAKQDPSGTITTTIIRSQIEDDPHRSPSIGIDQEGYIHWAGNMHNTEMSYYKSLKPGDISSFNRLDSDTLNGGMFGRSMSYGRFIVSRKGTLMFLSRQRVGIINDGWIGGIQCGHIQVYNTETKQWVERGDLNYSFKANNGQTITGGMSADRKIKAVFWDNSGAGAINFNGYQGYKVRVVFDKNNRMHMAWTVAKNPVYSRVNNDVANAHTHLMYAFSDDEGLSWKKADGSTIQKLPITTATGELVYQEDTATDARRMFNGGYITFTSDNRPVVMAFSSSQDKMMVFERSSLQNSWLDVSNGWANGWPGEALTDDNGWITILQVNRHKRSSDNGSSFRQYEKASNNRSNDGQSIDYQYYYETGQFRNHTIIGNVQTVRTTSFQNSLPGQVQPPVITPGSGNVFSDSVEVQINNVNFGAQIRYTTDGSEPSLTNGILFSNTIKIFKTTTIKAISFIAGKVISRIAIAKIVKELPSVDTQPPTVPSNLKLNTITSTSANIEWLASTDNQGVKGYEVFINGEYFTTTTTNSINLNSLVSYTTYSLQLLAFDSQNNRSTKSATLVIQTDRNKVELPFTTTQPVLDGIKDQSWNGAIYSLSKVNTGTVRNGKDLSVNISYTYDINNLYAYYEVIDDSIEANSTNWWENDGIELYIDATNRKGTTYLSTDYQIVYTFNELNLREASRNAALTGAQFKKVNTAEGYNVELVLPWSIFKITPTSNFEFGLEAMAIDRDSNKWNGKKSFNNNIDNSWSNPSTFGNAILGTLILPPSEVFKFSANRINNSSVSIEFGIENPSEVKEFILERGISEQLFQSIGNIIPFKNITYTYVDNTADQEFYFYRIKVVYKNGNSKYTKVIKITNSNVNTLSKVLPTVTKSSIQIIIPSSITNAKCDIYNEIGKHCLSMKLSALSNLVDISRFSAGIYFIAITDSDNKRTIHRVIKL